MKLNEKSRAILEAIAEGHSFDQILLRKPELSYNDIFRAAGEALECLDQPEQNKSYSVEAIRQQHQRAYEKWSMEDDAELAELFRNGVSVSDIAKKLQRQSGAIHMTQDQINVTTMHSATDTYMDQNNSIWSGNAAMSAAVAQLKANNGVIAQKRNTQETATEGVQAQAVQARHDLEDKILEIADQIYALAASTNNPSLEEQSHFTQAQLDGMDSDKLLQTGANVAALATSNLAGLASYGVTAADVTALTTAGTTFTPLKNAYRDAVSKKSGQTGTIPQAIAGNQSLLKKQLDKQMTRFKNSNPDFYAGYLTARGIVGRRSHHAGKAAPQAAAQPQK